jgi:Tol biopolymer transport system component
MARRVSVFLAAALALGTAVATRATGAGDAPLDAMTRRFAQDVGVLAADDMEGRGLGTAGLARAATWIEGRLKGLKLEPAFAPGTYRQPFPVKTGVERGEGNAIEGLAEGDWTPLGPSSSGAFSGEVAFVGYGIEAPPVGYRELDGIDLKGRVALMLRYEPQERDPGSPFDGRRPSRWSALRYRVHQARERGAVAVAFVTGPLQDDGKDKLPAFANDGPESPAGLPVLQLRMSAAQRLLAPHGIDLKAFQEAVDRDLAPRSRVLPGLRLSGRVAVRPTSASADNLAGVLPGRGPLAREVVVIGAHYDHLGFGGAHSLRPNERAVHNGADDNASGTVAVLLAAERMRDLLAGAKDRRTVVFTLFAAEEVGLGGSSAFVAHPPFPLERTVAMVNLDMVGRLREERLAALGADSAAEWAPALATLGGALGLHIAASGDGYGPSDQTPFYGARIPVLHFFTGSHDAYHTPEDDPTSLDARGGARVAELTARLGEELALGRLTPRYAQLTAGPAQAGDSRDLGAYLGTVPDYSAMDDTSGSGVLLADVRAGGPADRAGLRGKDRIVDLAGTRIANLYDMTYALQDHRPGETVDVVVLRDGQRVTLRATLGSRSDRARVAPAPDPQPSSAPPADPHAAPPAKESAPERPGAAFFANRPGRGFVAGAGKPFAGVVEGERHLADLRQLTFGGENAEAYFSPDGRRIIYQSTPPGGSCDQQFTMDLATGDVRRVSSGKGRTTCGYFDYPEGDRIVYASTEAAGEACPTPPDRSRGYVWPVDPHFDIFEAAPDGSAARRLTTAPGYDAEATWCPRGGRLVFTSSRDGDLELYEMDEAGEVRRLTHTPGYDGGAFYSPDCSEIVWRASRPEGAALDEYRQLLAQGLVRPSQMELFVMNADGRQVRQVTRNGAANFCPYFHPDGQRIVYSSNAGANPREFDLFLVSKDGGEPQRITFAPGFDGFPVFSPDGEWLVFASNRADLAGHQTNLFLARWVE